MSQQFVAGFFPEVTRSFPRVFQFLFPDDVAEKCPEVIILGTIRNPSLAIFALWGISIGARGVGKYSTLWWWRTAFGCFGLMNLVALPLHCLVSVTHGKTAVEEFPWLWLFDCILTGISSFAIVGACLDKLVDSARFWQTIISTICLSSALFAVVIFYTHAITLGVELYYLVPLIFAGQTCFLALLKNFRPGCTGIVVLGGLLAGAGILADPFFCRSMEQTLCYDLFTAPALMFAGCDVAFVGLETWIDSVYNRRKTCASPKLQ